MLSHTRMGVPYEYTHMGRPIRVWANIRIWGRTVMHLSLLTPTHPRSGDGGDYWGFAKVI